MQLKGKIFTIAGIVLLFGYFIKDSFKDSYNATQIIMVGADTLGRDWGAMAEQAAMGTKPKPQNDDNGLATISSGYGSDSSNSIVSSNDPYSRPKFNQDNYSSIESPDGREIITGYSRPEQQQNENNDEYNQSRIQTRHQKERKSGLEEPSMIYKE